MAYTCSQCSYVVSEDTNGKRLPWCPRCGADVKWCAASVLPASVEARQVAVAGAAAVTESVPASADVWPTDKDDAHLLASAAEDGGDDSGVTAEISQGDPEQVYTARILWQALAWLCALVTLGIVGITLYCYLKPVGKNPPSTTTMLGIVALFGLLGCGAIFVGLRLRGLKYLVFPDRLVEVQGGKVTTVRWDRIREVFHLAHRVRHSYRIVARSGQEINVTGDICSHNQLGELICERAAEMLFPEAWRQLEQGRNLSFGPITMDRAGLDYKGQRLPWQSIAMTFGFDPNAFPQTGIMGAMSDAYNIHLKITPTCTVDLGDIPNYRLFEKLVSCIYPACLPAEKAAGS